MGIHQAVLGSYATTSGGGSDPTWALVDSEFKQSVGASFSVDNVQTGDFLYWTQASDSAGSIATLTGWDVTFDDSDNTPSFKEQYRVATSNEGTVTVTSESDTEVAALLLFRCSTGATSIDANASALSEGTSGNPVVPSANTSNNGTSEAYSLCVVSGYLDDDEITTCTPPSGLSLAGFAAGSRQVFFFTDRSSLMVGYAVIPNAGATAPAGAGNSWSTDGTDYWNSTAWYISPS